VKRAPAHAGGLRTSERLAFVAVFSLMAAFVVGLTVLAAKTGGTPMIGDTTAAGAGTAGAASQQLADGTGQSGGAQSGAGRAGLGHTGPVLIRSSSTLGAQLAASLRAAAGGHLGRLSVGVIDAATGAAAWYHAGRRYDTASIVKMDILAALLYLDQRARKPVTKTDAALAVEMIQDNSAAAAARLWQAIGGGHGMAVANKALRLRHTTWGPAGPWDLTRSTAADQLQLLEDLTATNSMLRSGGRDYAVGLLAGGVAGQPWGVAAAASPVSAYAVTDGTRRDPHLWLADSIGVIQRDRHELLIVVLSVGYRTQAEGTRVVRAAVMAAATVIMAAGF
jgi:hypothetical protein